MSGEIELTILMPCLNEAETLAVCIEKAKSFLDKHNVSGEVLIADNGSTDGSQQIAKEHGARVVDIPERGYGSALIGGCNAACGKYVIMGDADDSYDFTNLMPFVERLRAGDDLVIGNRFKGGISKGAMPPLHKYLGNPVLSGLGRIFYKCPIRDFHCGLRGYNTEGMRALGLHTIGMEYASEMIVQAVINGYTISEVPTTLSPDGRSRPPHLRSWHDGWRHLKFLLLHSPNWLFLYPGFALMIIGLIIGIIIEIHPVYFRGVGFDINTLLYSVAMIIVGFNLISFHTFAKIYAMKAGFIRVEEGVHTKLNAENCALFGLLFVLIGIAMTVMAFVVWGREGFGRMNLESFMKLTIPAIAFILMGIHLVFSGLFIDLLKIKTKT
jgi:glycosyltransferase involved in cell wall biosynthesis